MSTRCKIVLAGGASITWTPAFVRDLCQSKAMKDGLIVLVDHDRERLAVMAEFSRLLSAREGGTMSIEATDDLDKALPGADAVINSVLVGGHDAWKEDLRIILEFGLEHPKGMSVGPGGLIMALKQIPFALDLASRMERFCPDAWLLNYANPMQAITLALNRCSSVKTIGLCHGIMETMRKIAKRLDISMDNMHEKAGGVNHFAMLTRLGYDNQDLLALYAQRLQKAESEGQNTGDALSLAFYRQFGCFPTNGDIHISEFIPGAIQKDKSLSRIGLTANTVMHRIEDRMIRWKRIESCVAGDWDLTDIVPEQSTERIADIVDALILGKPAVLYVNMTNHGHISNLDPDICVEIKAQLSLAGCEGFFFGPLPCGARELTALQGTIQDLAVRAAISGSRKYCLQALALDPMCMTMRPDEQSDMLEALLTANKPYLHHGFYEGEKA